MDEEGGEFDIEGSDVELVCGLADPEVCESCQLCRSRK